MVTHQLQVRCRPVKVRRSETDVLPLSHPTNCTNHTKAALQPFYHQILQNSHSDGWLKDNGIVHINKVFLHQVWLILGRVTVPWYTILVLNQPSRPTQPGHPSMGRHNEYWQRFRPPLGKKLQVLHNSRP